jgi:hypothetical protein
LRGVSADPPAWAEGGMSMEKTPFLIGLCPKCQQLTDECTCPARFERQRLIEIDRQAWRNRKAEREGQRDE